MKFFDFKNTIGRSPFWTREIFYIDGRVLLRNVGRNVGRNVVRNVGRNVVRKVRRGAGFSDFAETSFIISLKKIHFPF